MAIATGKVATPLDRAEFRQALAPWAGVPIVAVVLGLLDGCYRPEAGVAELAGAAEEMAEGDLAAGYARLMSLYMALSPERRAGKIDIRERRKSPEKPTEKRGPGRPPKDVADPTLEPLRKATAKEKAAKAKSTAKPKPKPKPKPTKKAGAKPAPKKPTAPKASAEGAPK